MPTTSRRAVLKLFVATPTGARKNLNWTARSDELVHAYEMSFG